MGSNGAVEGRRLVVNADDFGLSQSVNEAVIRAHREGILTTASLMVNEPGFEEAVELAKKNPRLGVGLHISLLFGRSALPHNEIPGLVGGDGQFSRSPAAAGCRFFFQRDLQSQLRREIHEQFARFRDTGLELDHVNGHLHMHLHPTVFSILMEELPKSAFRRMRLTRDPLGLNLRLAKGEMAYRLSHALIFGLLSWKAGKVLKQKGIAHTRHVFGLLQNGRVDETYVLGLLPALPEGDSELYSHPSLHDFKHEFDALVSSRVRELVSRLGIKLVRYQDL